MSKIESRQETILKLISDEIISRQEVLLKRLNELGYNVTQSTVSRDIKKMGIIKACDGGGNIRYMTASGKITEKSIFSDAVTDIDYAGHITVIKCRTGMAQAVCATLDNLNYPEIVGTIAGDDTIFALMRSENDARHLVKNLKKELNLD